jgi:hypothetical protein
MKMKVMQKLGCTVALAGLLVSGSALANTATFDGQFANPLSYTEDGITFTSLYPGGGGEHVHLGDYWTDAIANHGGCCTDPINITFSGGTFTLTSLDILYDDGRPTMFTGSNAATFTVSGLGHVEFGSLFAGVTSVLWSTTGQSMADNVTVTAVPEPETYALFMAGLGLMGFIARRRKNGQA